MFLAIIESLVQICNENSYTNLVVNHTIQNSHFTDYEKKLYTKIVYGVVENKILIDYLLQPFIKGKRIKPFLKNALRIGVYGIDYLAIQDYYLVNTLVEEVKKRDYKASTFLNAILRRYQNTKRRSLPNHSLEETLSIQYSINQELVHLLYQQYPKQIKQILEHKNYQTNSYLVNTLKISIQELKEKLDELDISYQIEQESFVETNSSLIDTPLFKEGCILPQDKSSIEVGLTLKPAKGSKVLDCCSAPGSKAMHCGIMMENEGKIVASDIYPHKIKLIEDATKKLGLRLIHPLLADATEYDYQEQFDYLLADVPCSGLGVMHHKPDLKYQMTIQKIQQIQILQKKIVENVIQFLKPGGVFVYSTCTINQNENEIFIAHFLKQHPNFSIIEEIKHLPNEKQDGFYICKLKENTYES